MSNLPAWKEVSVLREVDGTCHELFESTVRRDNEEGISPSRSRTSDNVFAPRMPPDRTLSLNQVTTMAIVSASINEPREKIVTER